MSKEMSPIERLAGRPVTFGVSDFKTATSMSGLEFLHAMISGTFPAPPICEVLDFILVEAEHGRVIFEGLPSDRFRNPLGTVHGGWMSTVLDSALGCAVHSTLKAGQGFTTVDLAVSFVRAVHQSSGKLRCEAKVIHVGGRIATAEARLVDAEGKLYAHGTTTCLVMPIPAG
ncbi:PaaI family thioesterase [Hyphomicrobium sp. CS1BSMeth3]|uniref:PaaI family thioesterase n=1 Tax=Hyphomicrobium sp. CS1BSMeth3 TaxID=1892844 RepID=UPI00093129D4|nr:PaaI family thioesterase [Hyphomicrobium sp. CS1BSMeth3]